MASLHCANRRRAGTTAPIATMQDGRPGDRLTEAILANVTIPLKDACGAHQPVVVQCLNDRNTLGLRRVIDRW